MFERLCDSVNVDKNYTRLKQLILMEEVKQCILLDVSGYNMYILKHFNKQLSVKMITVSQTEISKGIFDRKRMYALTEKVTVRLRHRGKVKDKVTYRRVKVMLLYQKVRP